MHPFHTIIEPFRIKSVETWEFTTREERIAALARARRLPRQRRTCCDTLPRHSSRC